MKKVFSILTATLILLSFSACGLVPSVELTDDEQKVISEYAAGLLLKYDKNYGGSLEDIEEDDGVEVVGEEENSVSEADGAAMENNPSTDADADMPQDDTQEEYSDLSIAETIGLDGFDIIYKSRETHSIYPEEESDELVFSMQAQRGMELLVINFGITNDSTDTRVCDILDSNTHFRLLINGSERVNACKTILLNDLSSYDSEIAGYAMTDAVLVFEVSEGTSDSIENIDLIVKNNDVTTTHKLR